MSTEINRRRVSEAGISLIKQFEGIRLIPYKCSAGVWTVGIGHTEKRDIGPITEEYAITLLRRDLERVEEAVNALVLVPLSQAQFDAIASLTFNIGIGAFRKSTLLKYLNEGNYRIALIEFIRWNKVNGKESHGLTERRKAEMKLFASPDEV